MVGSGYPPQTWNHITALKVKRGFSEGFQFTQPTTALRAMRAAPTEELDTITASPRISKYSQHFPITPSSGKARQKAPALAVGSNLRHPGPYVQTKQVTQVVPSHASGSRQRPASATQFSMPQMQLPVVRSRSSPGAKSLLGRPYPPSSTPSSSSSHPGHASQGANNLTSVLESNKAQREPPITTTKVLESPRIRQDKGNPTASARESEDSDARWDESLEFTNPFFDQNSYPKAKQPNSSPTERRQRPSRHEPTRASTLVNESQPQTAIIAQPVQEVAGSTLSPSKRPLDSLNHAGVQERTPKRFKTSEPNSPQHRTGSGKPVHQFTPKKSSPLSNAPIKAQPMSSKVMVVPPDFEYACKYGTPFPGTSVSSEQLVWTRQNFVFDYHCQKELQLVPGSKIDATREGIWRDNVETDILLAKTIYGQLNEDREEGVGLANLVVKGDVRQARWRAVLMNEAYDPVETSSTLRCPTFENNSWWTPSRHL